VIVEIVEAGMIVAAGAVGNVMGWSRGRAEKNIINLFTTGQAENLWCLCGHAMSFHEKGTGLCCHQEVPTVAMVKSMASDTFARWRRSSSCHCQTFVGDASKNPPPVQTRKDLLDL
jgi:hypothetical protein